MMIACMQILRDTGLWYSAEYSTFSISDEVGKYRLTVAGYSGDSGDAITATPNPNQISNGMKFSTRDSDNDAHPTQHCAGLWGRGWWDANPCSGSCVNSDPKAKWAFGTFTSFDVVTTRMLVKSN